MEDRNAGVNVTALRISAFVALESEINLDTGVLGDGGEIYLPAVELVADFESPEPPSAEPNPYRPDAPNEDLQRIHREQHNFNQAGDTTFPWGILTEIGPEKLYNLGSLGKFYHNELGIIRARYCEFRDWQLCASKAVPVGQHKGQLSPWVVTNTLDKSAPDLVSGIAIPYSNDIASGIWYGWVIESGFVPVELDVSFGSLTPGLNTEYGWHSTGRVRQDMATRVIGRRKSTGTNPALPAGAFFVEISPTSRTWIDDKITARLVPVGTALADFNTRLTSVANTVAGHTTYNSRR